MFHHLSRVKLATLLVLNALDLMKTNVLPGNYYKLICSYNVYLLLFNFFIHYFIEETFYSIANFYLKKSD